VFGVRELQPLDAVQVHDLHAHVHAEVLEEVTPDQLVHELFHVFGSGTHQADQLGHFIELLGGDVAK